MSALPRITIAALDALIERGREDVEAAHEAALFIGCDYFEWSDPEELQHSCLEDAVASYLDTFDGAEPESVEITGFNRQHLGRDEPPADLVLDHVIEHLDEMAEYNNGPNPTKRTPAMLAAAEEFCRVIRREYVPWNCEEACVVVYDAATLKRIAEELWPEETKA